MVTNNYNIRGDKVIIDEVIIASMNLVLECDTVTILLVVCVLIISVGGTIIGGRIIHGGIKKFGKKHLTPRWKK